MMLRLIRFLVLTLAWQATTSVANCQGFSISISNTIFADCGYPSSFEAPQLTIQIKNVTNAADTKLIAIRCIDPLHRESLQTGSIQRNIVLRNRRTDAAIQISTVWAAAAQWDLRSDDRSVSIGGISLPYQSYRLVATLSDPIQTRILLDQPFIVDAVTGPSVLHFRIDQKNIFGVFKDKYFDAQTGYLALIVALIGILLAAIRKKIENLASELLDALGARGKGRLAVRRFHKIYVDYLVSAHKYLRLLGFGGAGINRPLLEEVFISLRVSGFDTNRGLTEKTNKETSVPFESAVARFPRLVVLGGPGAGKTTILSYILLQCLNQRASMLGLPGKLLPLYVPLRRVSNRDTSLLDDILSPETQILPGDILRECPPGYLKRELERGVCIVLLDGLDEVTDVNTHRLAAEKINRLAADFPENRFIVTCRLAGWEALLNDFTILETEDFSRQEVHRFVFGWHRAVISQEVRSQIELKFKEPAERAKAWEAERVNLHNSIDTLARRLVNSIEGNARLLAVAKNPMLLSLICLVHYVKDILPKERPVLYERCIDLLIDAWDRSRNIMSTAMSLNAYQKEAILRSVALAFQIKGKGEAARSELEQLVDAEAQKLKIQMPGTDLLAQIEQRSGILIERSIDVLGFSHLTLQEYLVAKHLQLNPRTDKLLEKNFDNQEWREVILLYAGIIDDASQLISQILLEKTEARLLLAAFALGEARQCEAGLTQAVLSQLLTQFKERESNTESMVNALAAVCADFRDHPVSPEQLLSAGLMQYVGRIDICGITAIRALAKGRVTKALPAMVQLLVTPATTSTTEVIGCITLFGNTALPYIRKCIEEGEGTDRLHEIISVLTAIDTPEAAKLLVECYGWFTKPSDHAVLSYALATALRNQVIEADLLLMRNEDVPLFSNFLLTPSQEHILWPYPENASRAFIRLCLKIRDDITMSIASDRDDLRAQIQSCSFKFAFPAIVHFLKHNKGKLSRSQWQDFGFEARSEIELSVLQRVHKELRSSASLVSESIRRLIRSHGSATETSRFVRVFRWPVEVVLTGLILFDSFFSGLIVWAILIDSSPYQRTVWDYSLALLAIASLCRFLGMTIWGSRIAGSGRRIIGALNSFPMVLRRTPYITAFRSWTNFVLLHAVVLVFSSAACLCLRFIELTVLYYRHLMLRDIAMITIPSGIFVLASMWFYKYQALKVDAAALLVKLHPGGKNMLGLATDARSKLSSISGKSEGRSTASLLAE